MFSTLTPEASSDLRAPATRAEMISVFHLAWTMAMRSLEPDDMARYQLGASGKGGGGKRGLAIVNLGFTWAFQRCHDVHSYT